MKSKKLLTLDDLVSFFATGNLTKFSSEESGYSLSVQVPSTFKKSKKKNDDPTIVYGDVKLYHIGRNRNGSNVTKKAAEDSMGTIAYKPLLADFCEIDGVRDFTYHAMKYNEDGSIEYIEKQVGAFTSDEPYMAFDEEEQKDFIYATVAIPRNYTDTVDILERKGGSKVSVELVVEEMSYDVKEKLLNLDKIIVSGATLLGTDPDTGELVEEGMKSARIDLQDFSVDNNSVSYSKDDKLIEVLEKLNDTLTNFNIKADDAANTQERRNEIVEFENTIEEQIVEESVAEEVITNSESTPDESIIEEESVAEEIIEEAVEEGVEAEFDETEEIEETVIEEESVEEEPVVVEEEPDHSATYSMTMNNATRNYSISMNDVIYALQTLVNDTYGEADCDWYSCDVYGESDKFVVMHGWNHSYRQSYKVKNGVYSLVGDRVEVFAQWMTKDEISQFESMKKNYSTIESELNTFKLEAERKEKSALLESEDYTMLADSEEFKELTANMDNYSLDELSNKADLMLAKYAKASFAKVKPENKKTMVFMASSEPDKEKSKKPYGGIFERFYKEN